MPEGCIQTCVTSPPYFQLRDYGVDGQIGLEPTLAEYVAKLVAVFEEVRRVLKKDGTCWVNLGDSFNNSDKWGGASGCKNYTSAAGGCSREKRASNGLKPKDLMGVPWRVAFALQDAGWYLRRDIIWSKLNPMPESVRDRPATAHEYIFLLSKSERYFYDAEAIREPCAVSSLLRLAQDVESQNGSDRANGGTRADRPMKAVSARDSFRRDNSKRAAVHPGQTMGTHRPDREDTFPTGGRNCRSVWEIATQSFTDAHFATFPEEIPRRCILAGSRPGDMVLDPFGGSGTVGKVAKELGRDSILIELNPTYAEMARRRIADVTPALDFAEVPA